MAVVVTGGSKGIGRDCALFFADRGETVILNYLSDDEAARQTCEEIRAHGGICHLIKADAGTVGGCAAIAEVSANVGEQKHRSSIAPSTPWWGLCLRPIHCGLRAH